MRSAPFPRTLLLLLLLLLAQKSLLYFPAGLG
jgi:hypothetical protein